MSFTWMALMAGNRKLNCWPAMQKPWIASVEPLTSRTRPSLGWKPNEIQMKTFWMRKNNEEPPKKNSAPKFFLVMKVKVYDYLHLKSYEATSILSKAIEAAVNFWEVDLAAER